MAAIGLMYVSVRPNKDPRWVATPLENRNMDEGKRLKEIYKYILPGITYILEILDSTYSQILFVNLPTH